MAELKGHKGKGSETSPTPALGSLPSSSRPRAPRRDTAAHAHKPPLARSIPAALTGALLDAAALLQRVAAQLAVEIFLPKLSKPDVAAVVVQRPAGEVAVETCPGKRGRRG